MTFNVNLQRCVNCGKCVKDCPTNTLEMKDGVPSVRDGKGDGCIRCQHCLAVCPEAALTIDGVGSESLVPLSEMPIPPPNEVANLIRSRRSIRQYVRENVPREDIDALLETLKYVPTGCNNMDLTFVVVDDIAKMDECRRKVVEVLSAKFDVLPDFLKGAVTAAQKDPKCDPFFRGAPHILIVQGDPKAVTPQVDCDAAIAYFDILAQAHGFGTTWCGFLKIIVDAVPEVADIFGIPRGAPFYAMLFGNPAVDYVRCVDRSSAAKIVYR